MPLEAQYQLKKREGGGIEQACPRVSVGTTTKKLSLFIISSRQRRQNNHVSLTATQRFGGSGGQHWDRFIFVPVERCPIMIVNELFISVKL